MFGEAAFTVQMIPMQYNCGDAARTGKRVAYNKMVQTHGSVQLSMGSATINGLIHLMEKYKLDREDKNGNKLPTIRKLVHAVMR